MKKKSQLGKVEFIMFKRLVSLVEHHVGYPTVVVVLSLLTGATLYAAGAPAMQWHKGHGTSYGNHVHEGIQTSDGGYIGIGQTWESGSSDYTEMLVIKTNASGYKEWQKIIGTSNQYDIGICVAEVSDGFICGGGLYDSGNQKRALVKLDYDGNIVSGWPKYYSGSQNCAIRGVDILDDGSIVATGYKNSEEVGGYVFIVDDGTGFIMKTDSNGNLQWSKTLSVPQGTKVRQISTGFAICSTDWYYNGGDHQDAVLIKTNSSGNETNKYHYGGTGGEHCYDFDLTSDGGYILGGHTTSYGVANWDYYLVKVNSSGDEQWHKTFGQPRGYNANYIHDEAYGVRQTPDGGYIIAGGSGDEYSYSDCSHSKGCSDEWKAYLVKTDGSGNKLWEDVYPPQADVGNTAGEYLGLTTDGGYIVFTDTDCFYGTVGSFAFGFMKIAPDTPPPPTPPTPDIDGSGDVNFADYSLFAPQWMRTECNDCNGADFTTDGNVDCNDLALFADNWLRDYSLVGYWKLDGDANDSSGYGHDGTAQGGAVWVDDSNRGWCLSLDGDDDYVELGTISGTDNLALAGSNFTICSWIKPNLTGDGYQRIVDKSNGSNGVNGYALRVHTDGKIAIHVAGNGFRSDGSVITAGIWQHVVVTGDGSDYQFYVDGLPVSGSFSSGSYNSPPSVNTNMRIGTWNHSTGREFNGLIDEVRIYDKALNQQAIEALAGI